MSDHRPRTPTLDVLTVPVEAGVTLVEASAGTGKTFALAGLVLRLVLEGRVEDLSRLLVVTFTNAATDELKTRIRRALREALVAFSGGTPAPDVAPLVMPFLTGYGEEPSSRQRSRERLAEALAGADAAAVSTIHSFCQRELSRAAFASGTPFVMDFVEDAAPLLSRATADAWHRLTHGDERVARLAVREGWLDGAFLPAFNALGTHPRARLEPAAPPLDHSLSALYDASAKLAEALDPSFERLLEDVDWYAKSSHNGVPAAAVAAALHSAALDPCSEAVATVLSCTTEQLRKSALKRSADACEDLVAHPAVSACDAFSATLTAIRFSAAHTFSSEVEAALSRIKARLRVLTPDDLLRRLYDALEDPARGDALAGAIADRYDAALIDEFQDTDPYQLAIFRRALAGRPTFFVGDPKQAIYAFRGADLFAYLDARQDASRRFALDTNWRSSSKLIEAVNALFERPPRPFVYEGIPYEGVRAAPTADDEPLRGDDRGAFVWWSFGPKQDGKPVAKGTLEPQLVYAVVHEVRRLLAGGYRVGARPLRASDLAVLVRTNRQAEEVQSALRNAGVPSVVSKGGDVIESRETAEVERVLTAVANPTDGTVLRAALATELWGFDAERIAALDADASGWSALVQCLDALGRLWRRHGVLRALNQFLADESVAARLLGYADGERRMTNVRHVAQLLHQAESVGRRSPSDLLRWLATRDARPLTDRGESELRLESDADAVQVTTVHASKGLQYGVVFAPFLGLTRAPNWSSWNGGPDHPFVHEGDGVVFDLGSDQLETRRAQHEAERLAEEVRLAYVALTRAKHRCYVAWGPCNTGEASGLGYLLHGYAAPMGDTADHCQEAITRTRKGMLEAESTLRELVAACPAMSVEPLPAPSSGFAPSRISAGGDASLREARTLSPEAHSRLRPRTRASFSAWTRGTYLERPGTDEVGIDMPIIPDSEEPAGGMHGFAAGLQAGLCLHGVLERADFREPQSDRNRRLVERTLAAYDLADPVRHRSATDPVENVLALLTRLAEVSVPMSEWLVEGWSDEQRNSPATSLGRLAARQRLTEWRFVLPLGSAAPAQLADAFAAHASPRLRPYAGALRTLSADAVDGFLSGTADLVAEHNGTYWLLDWKSNRLGENDGAYAPDRLTESMRAHHYVLQYHLYLVALDAFLRTRLPDYDYDRHIGGVAYAFLRGAHRDDFGLYTDRPPRRLVEELSAVLRPAS